jgi:hypothetical protein
MFVSYRTFDDIEQFVADMTVHRQSGARFEAC